MQDEVQRIREALRDVIDFEIGLDVVSLGLVRDIQVTEAGVAITMILTSPMCPMAGIIMDEVQRRAEEAAGRPVEVTLGREFWDPEMMEAAAREALGF